LTHFYQTADFCEEQQLYMLNTAVLLKFV